MDGKLNQLEYFKKLSGSQEDIIDLNLLTSAQQARFISWSKENGFVIKNKENANALKEVSSFNPLPKFDNNEIKVGFDLQNIEELFPKKINDFKSDNFVNEIFTIREISYAETRSKPIETLAGIFAAKEAIIKTGFKINRLLEIEISHQNSIPKFDNFQISISHSNNYVAAIAILAKSNNDNLVSELNELPLKYKKEKKNYVKDLILIFAINIFTLVLFFFIMKLYII